MNCTETAGIRTSIRRFKTGTPARALAKSLDYEKMIPQDGDETVVPFSFMNDDLQKDQVKCWLTYTNETTHEVIRRNFHRSRLYSEGRSKVSVRGIVRPLKIKSIVSRIKNAISCSLSRRDFIQKKCTSRECNPVFRKMYRKNFIKPLKDWSILKSSGRHMLSSTTVSILWILR